MGPDEQLLMQVWDESASCKECDERGDGDVRVDEDDDDDDYFVGSWVFNMEELRQPCNQRHSVALHHDQNEHDQPNQLQSEAFSNREVVLPEIMMTVKVSYTCYATEESNCHYMLRCSHNSVVSLRCGVLESRAMLFREKRNACQRERAPPTSTRSTDCAQKFRVPTHSYERPRDRIHDGLYLLTDGWRRQWYHC